MEESDNKGVPPYRFNAKELDEETGLYYYGARYLDPTSVGWLSVDPLFEKYAGMSPYNYCAGNPVRYIDPNGESTHISEDGTVIGVNNDNDLGVYINAKDTEDKPKFIFNEYEKMCSDKNRIKVSYIGGKKIGETEYWDEFISPETGEIFSGIKIRQNDSFDEIVERYHDKAQREDLKTVASKSGGGGEYDVKYHLGMYGAKLEGKYVTTRSVGNYLAAYNAATCTYFKCHISFETFQKLAGALHIEESHGKHLTFTQKASIVISGKYSGCSDEKAFQTPPTFGEVSYQYRMSKKGWNHANK